MGTEQRRETTEEVAAAMGELSASIPGFAVFIATLDDPVSSPYDWALRHQIAASDRAELYR